MTLPKNKGGLGLLDVKELARRLVVRWLVRALIDLEDPWAYFYLEVLTSFTLQELKVGLKSPPS